MKRMILKTCFAEFVNEGEELGVTKLMLCVWRWDKALPWKGTRDC